MKRISLVLISSFALAAAFVPAASAKQTATMKINSLSPTLIQAADASPSTGDVEGGVNFSPTKVFVHGNNGLGEFLRTDLSTNSNVSGSNADWSTVIGTDTCTRKAYSFNWDGSTGSPVSVTTLTELDPTTGDLTANDITLSPPLTITYQDGGETSVFSGCGRLLAIDGDTGKVYDIDLPSGSTRLATTLDTSTSPYFQDRFTSENNAAETGVVENFSGDLWLDYPVEGDGTSGDPGTMRRMNLRTESVQTIFSVPEGTGTDGYHYDWGDNPTFNVDPTTGTWWVNYEYGNNNDWISGQDSNASGYDEVLASFSANVTYTPPNPKPASKPSLAKKGTAGGTSARVKLGCGGSGKCKIELSGKLKGGSGKVASQTVKVKAGKKATVEVRYTQTLIDELNSRGGGKIKLTAKQVGGKSSSIVLVVPSSVTG